MNKSISVVDRSGFSPGNKRHRHDKPETWVELAVAAFLTVAAASILLAISWMLALSD